MMLRRHICRNDFEQDFTDDDCEFDNCESLMTRIVMMGIIIISSSLSSFY